MSSWIRRTWASTSIVRSNVLGQRRDLRAHRRAGARDDVGARRARAPSMMMLMPPPRLRHLPDDADGADAAEVLGRRVVLVVLLQQQQDQAVGAERAVDRSIETGRLTASGCSVSGKATVRRSGRTGSSDGSVGGGRAQPCGVASLSAGSSTDQLTDECVYAAIVDERQFFTEKPEQRPAGFSARAAAAPTTTRSAGCGARKKAQSAGRRRARPRDVREGEGPPRARGRRRHLQDCGKRFEIPSHQTLVFLEELEGLPKEDYDE